MIVPIFLFSTIYIKNRKYLVMLAGIVRTGNSNNITKFKFKSLVII